MSTAPAHTSLRSPHAESCGALALQPIGSGDEAALLAIFASTREQEREQFGWPEEQWNAFIRQQFMRSEEHTSELQSPCNLVCRLLLEKKKTLTVSLRPPEDPQPPSRRWMDRLLHNNAHKAR